MLPLFVGWQREITSSFFKILALFIAIRSPFINVPLRELSFRVKNLRMI